MLKYFMFMCIVHKHMDIRISSGFGFGATTKPMDTFMGGTERG
jgi:hypothetical protein